MSLKRFFASVAHAVGIGGTTAAATISTATLASVHQLGNSLVGSIAAAGETGNPIGAAVSSAIAAADAAAAADPSMTGPAKLKSAIAASAPAVITEAAKVGLSGVEAEAERYVEMLIENELSLVRQTPLAKLGAALLHDVGVSF